jgi:hypothetical protein
VSKDQRQRHELGIVDLRRLRDAADQIVELVADVQLVEQEIDQLARPAQVPRAVEEVIENDGTRETPPSRQIVPTGSEPSAYEVEIRDSRAVSKTSARGDAHLRNYVTTLNVTVVTGSLSPGAYQLAVRHAGDAWQEFPIEVR